MSLLSLSVLAFTGLPYFPLEVAFQQNGYAPSTIFAEVTGSESPGVIENASLEQTVTNGGFTIQRTAEGINTTLGDGIDETTSWTFDFTGDPNFDNFPSTSLAFARLDLTLVPKSTLIIFDVVRIADLPDITSPPEFENLPVDASTTVQIDLLDYYSSDDILQVLSQEGGQIPMFYADDSIISSARLILTPDTQP
jgi:hypothetical protein